MSYLERPCHLILISPLWSPLALRSCHMKTMKVKAASQISRAVAVPCDSLSPFANRAWRFKITPVTPLAVG